ncbi:hypothetical protein [Clostridium sp.]|uniref:hypothetical protein n=1 Tax=Clostridium sp. TaxID=1506 RepID=UPI00262C9907|nr:hypothetical protein [Clostridium sp.]
MIKLTNKKIGTVELYRIKLRENELLENNTNLAQEQFEIFQCICSYKNSDGLA